MPQYMFVGYSGRAPSLNLADNSIKVDMISINIEILLSQITLTLVGVR